VRTNGYSEPDFLGWEIKQYSVANLARPIGGAITLMTPEPTEGIYRDLGVQQFVRRFGYGDPARTDRLNFGGRHVAGIRCDRSGLVLSLTGYDTRKGTITSPSAGIELLTQRGECAARWPYAGLITHWNRKHHRAAYIPSNSRMAPERQYRFGSLVQLGEGTDFLHVLRAFAAGRVYYDPGIKVENASSYRPRIKRRSQFRIAFSNLGHLYDRTEVRDLENPT
jgi:hypothetical protein